MKTILITAFMLVGIFTHAQTSNRNLIANTGEKVFNSNADGVAELEITWDDDTMIYTIKVLDNTLQNIHDDDYAELFYNMTVDGLTYTEKRNIRDGCDVQYAKIRLLNKYGSYKGSYRGRI